MSVIVKSRLIPNAATVTYRQTNPTWEIRWWDGKKLTDMDLNNKGVDEVLVKRIHNLIVQLTKAAR